MASELISPSTSAQGRLGPISDVGPIRSAVHDFPAERARVDSDQTLSNIKWSAATTSAAQQAAQATPHAAIERYGMAVGAFPDLTVSKNQN
jgi:hypothetical protein